MSLLNLRFTGLILSIAFVTTGIGLAAAGGSSPLATPIAPFGCGA
jgi:hypothetical protein